MRRRLFLMTSVAWAIGTAMDAFGQAIPPRTIAILLAGTQLGNQPRLNAFRVALKEAGYIEVRDIVIHVRHAEDRPERLPSLAAELVALRPAVILTAGSAAVAAAKGATSSVPIVFASAGYPVEQGFIASLRRPGANVTGVMVQSGIDGKVLELMRETLPGTKRVGLLVHEVDPTTGILLKEVDPYAKSLRLDTAIVRVSQAEDLERAFGEIAAQMPDAIYVPLQGIFRRHARRIAELALKVRIPVFTRYLEVVQAGGLMSYDADLLENYRHAARLVHQILKGAKPGELPVEQPDRFFLTVNLKTAKVLGIAIPQTVMLRADRVIE